MCFGPQRRAPFRHLNFPKWSEREALCTFCLQNALRATKRRTLFRHLNFQKWSGAGVFCTFWLGNVLRATTACIFESQLQKVLRTWGVFSFFTCTCASRQNGVQFFISHLASCLRTRRFSEPTFRPSGATNHQKNKVFRDFPTFSRTWIFFLLRLSLFWFSFFLSSLLWLFPPLLFHIVGSLTSKLPSVTVIYHLSLLGLYLSIFWACYSAD